MISIRVDSSQALTMRKREEERRESRACGGVSDDDDDQKRESKNVYKYICNPKYENEEMNE